MVASAAVVHKSSQPQANLVRRSGASVPATMLTAVSRSLLSLLRAQAKEITLMDCIAQYTRQETLGKDDAWCARGRMRAGTAPPVVVTAALRDRFCPKCKVSQQATKKLDVFRSARARSRRALPSAVSRFVSVHAGCCEQLWQRAPERGRTRRCPQILIIQLKRFSQVGRNYRCRAAAPVLLPCA